MATWFKASNTLLSIEAVDVERETEQCLFVRDKYGSYGPSVVRTAKVCTYERYFPTWAEAQAYFVERAATKLEGARRGLQLAESALGNVKGMKPPADSAAATQAKS